MRASGDERGAGRPGIVDRIRTGLGLLATLLWAFLAIVVTPFWREGSATVQVLWARTLLLLAGVRVTVHGERATPPVIYASNHQSAVDILVVLSRIESVRFVAKVELRRAFLLGPAMAVCRHVFFDRKKARQSLDALRDVAEDVRKVGRSLLIFPEGTRFAEGRLGPLKRGVVLIARGCGLPIVPLGIVGSPEVLPPGSLTARRGEVAIHIGEPIDPADYEGRDAELLQAVGDAITSLAGYAEPAVHQARSRPGPDS